MAVIKLQIYVGNLANVMTLFDVIRVYRSKTGELGVYDLLTADADVAATLTGSQVAPFSINGKTLSFKIDGGSEQTVTFTTADPVPVDLAVGEVNNQTTGVTASEESGALKLTSDTTGTGSIIEITGGSALTDLGFTTGDIDNGEDQHITLVALQENYEFDDRSGDASYWYKTQYYNTISGAFSSLSDPVQGNVTTIIPSADLVTASIDIADVSGRPVEDMRISFYYTFTPPIQTSDIALLKRVVEAQTDQVGHAEIDLVKGAVIDVTFVGTGMVRRITVPDADFDLLDAVASADDNFQIQVPEFPQAIRRS
jgi:hypothetical protein